MSQRAPLLVGELNPYGADPKYALFCEPPNSSGGRLCRLICGLRRPTYLALSRVNLCTGKWSMKDAKWNAQRILDGAVDCGVASPSVIVLFGRKVADAFGVDSSPPFNSMPLCPGFPDKVVYLTLVTLPHPSDLCRGWSKPGAFERARALLREVCPDVPWGEAIERRTA